MPTRSCSRVWREGRQTKDYQRRDGRLLERLCVAVGAGMLAGLLGWLKNPHERYFHG